MESSLRQRGSTVLPKNTQIASALVAVIPSSMAAIRSYMRSSKGELTVPQFRVLVHLRYRLDFNSNSKLAESIGVSVPAMSRMITGLEKRNYVSRTADPNDRREYKISLTSKGIKVCDAIRSEAVQKIAEQLTKLNKQELKSLQQSLPLIQKVFEV